MIMFKSIKKMFSFDILDRVKCSFHLDEEWRRDRMRELLGLLPMKVIVKIGEMYDCKGHLTVTWRHRHPISYQCLIDGIWTHVFCEAPADDSVTHDGAAPFLEDLEGRGN